MFPTTGILDNFNRGILEGPPPSASWTTPAGKNGLVANVDHCESAAGGGAGWGVWNTIASGADCEVYGTASGAADDSWFTDLYARLAVLGDFTSNYYCLSAYKTAAGHLLDLYAKKTGEALARIARRSVAISEGDGIGMSCYANKVTAWHRPGSGAWGRVFIATDDGVPGAGYLALNMAEAGHGTLDDFGGGTPVAGIPKLTVSVFSAVNITLDGLNWAWTSGAGPGYAIWAVQGIPIAENGKMDMSFSLDSRGPGTSGNIRIMANGESGGRSPNVMGSYYVEFTASTLGIRNVVNGVAIYPPSATMYFCLRVWRASPPPGSYITGHLISFSWHNAWGDVTAEYP